MYKNKYDFLELKWNFKFSNEPTWHKGDAQEEPQT